MTLSKIARIANVSVSTVSKVFSNSHEISDETKEKVIEVAKALGCFEKYNKPVYNKKLIAVLCPEVLGIHYSDMVTIIEEIIGQQGGTCLFSVFNFSIDTQNSLLDYYINFAKVDGIIVIEPVGSIDIDTAIPIVQVGHAEEYKNVNCVDVDIRAAMDSALMCLMQKGHTKIGYIGERYTPAEYGFFQQGMQKRGLEVKRSYNVITEKRFWDCGYCGMDALLRRSELPTAVFAAYSHIAVGILQRLNEANINVPEDISLICMDDISSVPYTNINLSCIKMHLPELCSEAVRLLYRAMENKKGSATRCVTVTRRFLEGSSIGEAPKG